MKIKSVFSLMLLFLCSIPVEASAIPDSSALGSVNPSYPSLPPPLVPDPTYIVDTVTDLSGSAGTYDETSNSDQSATKTFDVGTDIMKMGDRNDNVGKLQQFLLDNGFLSINSLPNNALTNYFGTLTRDAVKKFQESIGLMVTGFVGQGTLDAINSGKWINMKSK